MWSWLLFLILVGAAMLVLRIFNRLVRLRIKVRESWSAMDTELNRRYDLIPDLVEAAKQHATHEPQTLEQVIAARKAAAINHGPPPYHVTDENALTHSLRQFFAIAESHPQLKADESFQQLQTHMAETEMRISQARRFYNANVREMNTTVISFPWSLMAGIGRFKQEPYFEIEDPNHRAAPVAIKT